MLFRPFSSLSAPFPAGVCHCLINLVLLSVFLAISSTCGLNDSDLSNVTMRNLGGSIEWHFDFLSDFDGGFPVLLSIRRSKKLSAVKFPFLTPVVHCTHHILFGFLSRSQ